MKPEELKQYEESAKQPIKVGDRVWVGAPYHFTGEVLTIVEPYAVVEHDLVVHPSYHVSVHISKLVRLPKFGEEEWNK